MTKIELLIREIDRGIELSQQMKQAAAQAEWEVVASLSPRRDQCIQALAKLQAKQVVASVREKLKLLATLDQEILGEVSEARQTVKEALTNAACKIRNCNEYKQVSYKVKST